MGSKWTRLVKGTRQTKGKVSVCSQWRQTERPVAHTFRPRQRRSKSSTGPKTCARSAEWSSSWCAAKDTLADRTKVGKLVVDKWFVDKGFSFGKVPTGEVVFIHPSVVRGAEVLTFGTDAWVQVVHEEGVSSMQSLGARRVERGERQGEGKQSGRASETSSSVDGRAGSRVGEGSLRGMQPSSGLARRAGRRGAAGH